MPFFKSIVQKQKPVSYKILACPFPYKTSLHERTEVNISSYFFILVQLYSNQGVSCRNIGQEQLRVKQSFSARMTIKNSLFGFNSNGLLNHGKEGKTRYYVIQCRFREFLIQLCIKNAFICGSVQKYYHCVQKYCLFWGMCRYIHFWRNIDLFANKQTLPY